MGRKRVAEMNAEEYARYKASLEKHKEQMKAKRRAARKETKPKIKRPKHQVFVADFETSSEKWYKIKGYTEVWAWAITCAHIEREEQLDLTDSALVLTNEGIPGNPVDSFIKMLESSYLVDGDIIYFHNLKFDGKFLVHLFLERGWIDVSDVPCQSFRKSINANEFMLLADSSTWYSMTIKLADGKKLEIRDSAKRIPMTVKQMPKEFGLPIMKGEIDYDRDPALPISPKELKYIRHDVLIPAEILRQQYREGFTEMTTASYAYNQYKNWLKTEKGINIEDVFGNLDDEHQAFARRAYDGGEVFVNKLIAGKFLGNVKSKIKPCFTWDINSMYPGVYAAMPMPVGSPNVYRKGSNEQQNLITTNGEDAELWRKFRGRNKRYFIEIKKLEATLKPGHHLPSVGIIVGFGKRAYVDCFSCQFKVFADVRFEMILRDYKIDKIEFGDIHVYEARSDLFFDYVQKIVAEKNLASVEGHKMRKYLAKLKMNSLYGKFAQRGESRGIVYRWDDEEGEAFTEHYDSTIPEKYVPVAAIITAEARLLLITQANKFGYDAVAYMDTDSIHVLQNIDVDNRHIEHNVKPWRRRPLPANKAEKLSQLEDTLTQDQLYDLLIEFEYSRPDEVWCDEYDLGAFKIEGNFSCAKYLRAKTYFEGSPATDDEVQALTESIENEEWDGESYVIPGNGFNLIGCIKGAGIPDESKRDITVDNFELGLELNGKLTPRAVKGGCILVEGTYKIKEDGTTLKMM